MQRLASRGPDAGFFTIRPNVLRSISSVAVTNRLGTDAAHIAVSCRRVVVHRQGRTRHFEFTEHKNMSSATLYTYGEIIITMYMLQLQHSNIAATRQGAPGIFGGVGISHTGDTPAILGGALNAWHTITSIVIRLEPHRQSMLLAPTPSSRPAQLSRPPAISKTTYRTRWRHRSRDTLQLAPRPLSPPP